MRYLTTLVAGVALAGCGTIFEEDWNKLTRNVQEWRQENVGGEPRQAQVTQPQPREQAAQAPAQPAAQGGTAPDAKDQRLVRQVQQELKAEGIDPGPIDGLWGPRTSRAVRQFQKQAQIDASGQLDARTLSALGIAGDQTAAAGGGEAHDARPAGAAGTR
ncbi:MAG TPA: peptidoglycan-binding domain-containing protein [Burkholderiales bacterium]|nr:peptidoglycan-binding domain-containing protein [Burkholderiales bacterium]